MNWGDMFNSEKKHPKPTTVADYLAHLNEPERANRNSGLGAVEARTLSEMLDAGFEVQEVWGPLQMDVWRVTLRRGTVTVQSGIERGYSDGIYLNVEGLDRGEGSAYFGRRYPLIHFVWAIRTDASQADDAAARLIGWQDRSYVADGAALAQWRAVVDWLDHATSADVAAIAGAGRSLMSLMEPQNPPRGAAMARAVAQLEGAARGTLLAAAFGARRPSRRLGSYTHEQFADIGGGGDLAVPPRSEPARAADLSE